jgi:DNA-binding NtrC family response regulator
MLAHDWPGNVRELRNVVESAILTAVGAEIGQADLPPYFRRLPPSIGTGVAVAPAHRPSLEAAEKRAIGDSIAHNAGNLTRIARELGISKSTLYAKIRKHELGPVVERARRSE